MGSEMCIRDRLKGRLQSSTNEFVQEFTASISFDKRLYKDCIAASIAHAEMLSEIGVLRKRTISQAIHSQQ